MTPSRLGPKSPRVTNANHKIDNMHKYSSGWIALFFKLSLNPQMDFVIWITHSLREGLGELARLKNVCLSQQNQQPPKVEAWGYL